MAKAQKVPRKSKPDTNKKKPNRSGSSSTALAPGQYGRMHGPKFGTESGKRARNQW